MTTRSSHYLSTHTGTDSAFTKETPEQFLARGGAITRCPPRHAHADTMYTPAIAVDGHYLPVAIGSAEYVPNFVRDLDTYNTAQKDPVSNHDDGSVSLVRADERHAIHPNVSFQYRLNERSRREGADVMEE